MKKDCNFYIKLFSSTFVISAFTFGGGGVIIPLIKKKFVNELHLIDENEIMDMIAIAQSAPGVMAVNTSAIIGFRLAGIQGLILTILGTVTPPLIILSMILVFYNSFQSNEIINLVFRGMQSGIVTIMLDVTIDMINIILKEKKKISILLIPIALYLTIFTDINIFFIMLICFIVGCIYAVFTNYKKSKEEAQS